MTAKEMMERAEVEYIYKKSDFMESLIIFKESSFKYFKALTNGKFLIFHPFKMIHYYHVKHSKEYKLIDEYINKYLNENEGWYQWFYIPKHNLQKIKVEIYSCVGKHIKSARTCGYGFYKESDPRCSYGWACWVKRWKFIGNNDQEVIRLK